jgi:hypothetical protein
MHKLRKIIVLHTQLPPGAAADAVRRSIDEDYLTPLSLSGFQGGRPVLGEVGVDSFRLRKRIYYRNGFARQFFGRFEPESGGPRIKGHFTAPLYPRIFMAVWFTGVISIGTIMFVGTVRDLLRRGRPFDNNPWMGLVIPPALLLFGIGLLWFGRWLSRSGERSILEHLKVTLSARIEVQNPTRSLR